MKHAKNSGERILQNSPHFFSICNQISNHIHAIRNLRFKNQLILSYTSSSRLQIRLYFLTTANLSNRTLPINYLSNRLFFNDFLRRFFKRLTLSKTLSRSYQKHTHLQDRQSVRRSKQIRPRRVCAFSSAYTYTSAFPCPYRPKISPSCN